MGWLAPAWAKIEVYHHFPLDILFNPDYNLTR